MRFAAQSPQSAVEVTLPGRRLARCETRSPLPGLGVQVQSSSAPILVKCYGAQLCHPAQPGSARNRLRAQQGFWDGGSHQDQSPLALF